MKIVLAVDEDKTTLVKRTGHHTDEVINNFLHNKI